MRDLEPGSGGFEARALPAQADTTAPDGSEIRLLWRNGSASACHARLGAGLTARAVRHRTVDEYWFCLSGEGQIWRSAGGREEMTDLRPGLSLTLTRGTSFQWRNLGAGPLEIVIATLPPWPGEREAETVAGCWEATCDESDDAADL